MSQSPLLSRRRPMVAGNWKMNGSLSSVASLLAKICADIGKAGNTELVVFAPFIYLPEVQRLLQGNSVLWGAQTVSEHEAGAYTGEVAASMLTDFHCAYVLIGHSERRTLFAESDEVIAGKLKMAWQSSLKPVLCVGETLDQRESDITERIIAMQLQAFVGEIERLKLLSDESAVAAIANTVIAYEPVWAIGTGKTASPQQAQQVHAFIRSMIARHDATIAESLRILYGGSVKSDNAAELFAMPDIDGGLIGGASLQADGFLDIANAASLMRQAG